MSDAFDPYYTWLGIPPEDQPPDCYRLLGLQKYEDNVDVISHAADQRMGHLRTFQAGARAAISQRLLNELSQARVCLLDSERKSQYDAQLRLAEPLAEPSPATEAPPLPQPARAMPEEPAQVEPFGRSQPAIVAGRPKMARRRRRRSSGWMAIFWILLALVVLGGTTAWFVLQPDLQQIFGGAPDGENDAGSEPVAKSGRVGQLGPRASTLTGFDFDTTQYVELVDSANLVDFTQDCTVECWVRWPKMPSSPQYLVGTLNQTPDGAKSGWAVRCLPRNTEFFFEVYLALGEDRAARLPFGPVDYSDNWFHVAALRQGDVVRIFVNGKSMRAVRFGEDVEPNELPVQLGASPRLRPPIGLSAELAFLRLSSAACYAASFTPDQSPEKDASTVALVQFGKLHDGQFSDVSGNGHHGQIGDE
jgi:hypothetical protein